MDPAIQAAPRTVDPAYACTVRPIGNLARAVWDMWLPREWLTKLAHAADAAFASSMDGKD